MSVLASWSSEDPLREYAPIGHCIYCGSKLYGRKDRQNLGDEHIIPEGLDGKLLLPKASCGACEGVINKSEQFCQKQMLGAFRYQMNLGTKRRKERPKALPVYSTGSLRKAVAEIPVEEYPLFLMLPLFPPPEMIEEHPLRKSNLETMHPYQSPAWDTGKMALQNHGPSEIVARLDGKDYTVPSGRTDVLRFARMLAKIAHSYATAEFGPQGFEPLLTGFIRHQAIDFHPSKLVGGKPDVPVPSARHSLIIERRCIHGREFIVVSIRLFGDLGWPEYTCVVGVPKGHESRLVEKMLRASPLAILSFSKVDSNANPALTGARSTEYLCSDCSDVVARGFLPDAETTIKCAKCGTWNVTDNQGLPWRIPYAYLPNVPEPPDHLPRGIRVHPGRSTSSAGSEGVAAI